MQRRTTYDQDIGTTCRTPAATIFHVGADISNLEPRAMNLPLKSFRVVEHGTFITGPCTAAMLADLGADVIKVEMKTGDPFRNFQGGTYSSHFQAHNRNKRSISLNLKELSDREIFYQLISSADVYIQNFRPGTVEALGAGYDDLRSRNPRLIYCSISGFGADGPYADRPCYDTVAQAMSGFLSTTIDPDNPRLAGPPFADTITGTYGAIGIMAALAERGITGVGRLVEISMLEAMMHFGIEAFARYFSDGELREEVFDRPRVAQAFIVKCLSGGFIGLHLSQPEKFWTSLMEAMDAAWLGSDPRFTSKKSRTENYVGLLDEIGKIFATRSRAEWAARLTAHDVPFAPLNTLDEVPEDPQVVHANTVVPVANRLKGAERMIRSPFIFDKDRVSAVSAAPMLDQQGAAIRSALAANGGVWPESVNTAVS